MAQNKQPAAKRARNADGTYKGDDKSTPDVNEAYEQPKKATKATATPRNPASKQRAASAKAPAKKKKPVYAPKIRPITAKPVSPVSEMLTKEVKPSKIQEVPPVPRLSRYEPPPPKKKGRAGKMWSWLVGE